MECETLQIGQKVSEFQAQALMADGSFKDVKLADYKGKWLVLFFYPLDFTFVCPTEIQSFSRHYEDFKKLGAEVLSCSTDSVYSHKAWVENGLGKVKFPILGDTNHKVSKTFNVLLQDKGIALRGTFIIDPNGVLKSATVNDLPVGRSVEETLRTLQALQTGKLTGCGWKPGDKTLD
ncbi:MAG: peroxiredoxin [Candidatus Omnitrophica bacterium]|nr:peroxiredoxin [Candidatus Omnitrophota bacterium]